jgi:hypothetical protein
MKKIFILMVCLIAIGFAADMIPAHIPASAIHKEVLPATMEIKAECVYTGRLWSRCSVEYGCAY